MRKTICLIAILALFTACNSGNKESGNNTVVFTDYEDNLYLANNDDNAIQKIAENVMIFVAR